VRIRRIDSDLKMHRQIGRGGARNHVCVMLHLRARYVSKAAILTIPMPQSIGRKSKSRLNSKGLDR
jgi:hypothetical protein